MSLTSRAHHLEILISESFRRCQGLIASLKDRPSRQRGITHWPLNRCDAYLLGVVDLEGQPIHQRNLSRCPSCNIEFFISDDRPDLCPTCDDEATLIIRSFQAAGHSITNAAGVTTNYGSTTFSVQCQCARWIHCGAAAHRGVCFCRQRYAVRFVEAQDWSLAQGERCMDCGCDKRKTQSGDGSNPWRHLNAWQTRCDRCHTKAMKVITERVDNLRMVQETWVYGIEGVLEHMKHCDDPHVVRLRENAVAKLEQMRTQHNPRALVVEAREIGPRTDRAAVKAFMDLQECMKCLHAAHMAWRDARSAESERRHAEWMAETKAANGEFLARLDRQRGN